MKNHIPAIYLCFADRLREVRSDVLGPFVEVDSTYGSLVVTKSDGSEETIATRDEELAIWKYDGVEYPTVFFVSSPDAESIRAIAIDPSDR